MFLENNIAMSYKIVCTITILCLETGDGQDIFYSFILFIKKL